MPAPTYSDEFRGGLFRVFDVLYASQLEAALSPESHQRYARLAELDTLIKSLTREFPSLWQDYRRVTTGENQ